MSAATARKTAERIREHCVSNNKPYATIVFHGGEPLLGGVRHLDVVLGAIKDVFESSGIEIKFGMQSNGLLLTLEIAKYLSENDVSIGISIDGPPEVNDVARVDRRGRPTGKLLEQRLFEILNSPYKSVISGFLSVVNVNCDPIPIIEYLAKFGPPKIDFLLPYDTYDRPPPGKTDSIDSTVYAKWLIRAFDYWFLNMPQLRIREFDSIIRQLFGGSPLVESIGLGVVDLIVVETDGSIEAVDSLKGTYDGAAYLGYDVSRNSFDEVAACLAVRSRQVGAESLCETCKQCSIVNICGAGYLPNRYSKENGFLNPTIYCADMQLLISHVHKSVLNTLDRQLPMYANA